jgi:hypothetical protein
VSLHVLITDDHPRDSEGIFRRIGGKTPDALTDVSTGPAERGRRLSPRKVTVEMHQPEETVKTTLKSIYKKLGVRYWTEVNTKSILKEFWHRTRKGK